VFATIVAAADVAGVALRGVDLDAGCAALAALGDAVAVATPSRWDQSWRPHHIAALVEAAGVERVLDALRTAR
jgi:hypothetical protein